MPTLRSSARIKAQSKTVPTVRPQAPRKAKVAAVAAKSAEDTQPKKRQRKSSSSEAEEKSKQSSLKVRGVRGKLKSMTEMPLDILFETFSHLELADLLNLTKASGSLRSMLFSPSAISIWKSGFLNIEAEPRPPNAPPGMDVIQYAKLLYGRDCSYCSSRNATFAHWAERIRLCKECLEKSITVPKYKSIDWTARSLVPIWITRKPGIDKHDRWYFLKNDFENVVKQLERLAGEPEALNEYTQERKKYTEEWNKFASHCRNWESSLKTQRKRHLEDARLKRRADIVEKLKDLGWEDEINRLGVCIRTLPGVDQPKPLTPRIWDNIRDNIIETLEEIKIARLKTERLYVLRRRIGLLWSALMALPRTTDIIPGHADLCAMEPFHTMIFKTPLEDSLTQEMFADSLTRLPDIATEWRTSCVQRLSQLLPKPYDVPALELATVFFRCHWCTEPITYPRILKHACLTGRHSDSEEDDEFGLACGSTLPWNFGGEQVSFDEEASSFAREIIESCGQNPESVTMSEMDILDCRIECLCCAHPSRGRLVMGWKAALLHVIKTHYEEDFSGPRWKLVDDEAALTILKTKEAKGMLTWRQLVVECSKCGLHLKRQAIQTHIVNTHSDILPADIDKNIIFPVDSSMHQPPYPVRIPA